jgi:hypothetical protein
MSRQLIINGRPYWVPFDVPASERNLNHIMQAEAAYCLGYRLPTFDEPPLPPPPTIYMPDASNKTNRLTISIDRQAKAWAVFDDQCCLVKPFERFTDEAAALAAAKAWVLERGGIEPEIIYPHVTRITMSSGSHRRKNQ